MDLAYPIKGGRLSGPDPLKWSLRSMWHHSKVGEIYIAGGEPPTWIDREEIHWIHVPLAAHKRDHTGLILEAILASDISEEFLWMNDDFFLLEDREEWPLWASESSLREQIAGLPESKYPGHRYQYSAGLQRQLELLEEWGYLDPPSLDLHVPIPLQKSTMAEIYARARTEAPELPRGFFRSLYIASGLEVQRIPDVKLYAHTDQLPESGLVSTSPVSWNVGQVGKSIRGKYWRPAPWEAQK